MKETEKIAYKRGYRCTRDGKLMNPDGQEIGSIGTSRYVKFCITENKEKLYIYAHRLMAYQKYGNRIYNPDLQVRHLNNNKLDFSWNNIALGSMSENMMDRPSQERKRIGNIASSYNQKYSHADVQDYYRKCKSYKQTMQYFTISSTASLHYILKNSKANIGDDNY